MLEETRSRLNSYLKEKGYSVASLEKAIGVGNGSLALFLSGKNKGLGNNLEKILIHFPKLNSNWLLTGQGSREIDYLGVTQFDQKGGNLKGNLMPESKNEMHIKPPEEGVRYSEEKGGKVMGKVTPSEGAQMHIKPPAKEGLIAQEPERAFYGDLGAAIQKNMAQQAEIMKILLKRMQDLEQRMNSQDAHLPKQ